MSLWKKFQRVGKKAAKFRFIITYDELHIEYDKKWIPNSVCIIWCRRNRKMKSQWRKWEPCIENSFKGIVRWPIPETLDFEVTLYRDPRDPQSFEDKEWTIFVEDRNLADTHHHSKRHQIAASADFRLNNFVGANCGLEPLETDVRLPLRPNGKRCREAILKFKISCHFLKEGKATDEDMQSLASILISPTSATEEEGEDRPYWKKDKFNSLGRGSRPFEDPDPARHHASLNMSRDDAFFGTKISRLTRDWKATLGGQTAPLTTNNDQNNYTPSPPDSSPSPQHQLTPPVATVAPQTPVLSRANTPSSAMTIDDFNRLFLEGHRKAAVMAAVTSFSPQLELFPNTNTNNKGSSRKASFFDLEQVSNMFSKCNPPPSSIIPSSTAATSTTRMNENSKFISSPNKTQSTLPSTLALNTTSLDTATNHATKQDSGDVSHFGRFNDKLYASFRLPNTSHTKRKSPNSSGPGKNFITGPGEAQTEVNINNSIPHQQLAKFSGKTTPQNASGQMATPPTNKSLTSLKFIHDSKGRLSIATIPAASAAAKNISQGATTLPRRLSSSFRRRSSKRHETNAKMKLNNTLDVLIKDEDVQQHTPSQLLKTVPPCQGDNNNMKTLSFAKSNKNVMPITAQNPSSYSLNSPVSTVFEWCRSVCATEYAKLKSCTEEVVTPPPPSATTNYKIVIALHRKFNFEDRNSCESDILNNNYHANLNVEKFRDGTIFCTIIEHYLPGTIDLKSLDPGDVECNNRKVYKVINDLGIVPLVEPSEMMNLTVPLDKLAIITYLYQLKTFFERRLKSSKKLPETFDEQFRTNDPRLTSVEKSLLSDVIIEQHPDIAELIEESSDYLKRNSNYFLEESPPDTSRKKGETHKKEFKIEHQPVVDIGFPIVRTLPKPFNLTASTLLTPISKALPTESLPGHSRSSPLSVLTSSYNGLAVSDPLSRHPYYPKKSASNSINYQMRPNEESGKEDLFTSVLTERGQILKQKASDLIKQARREAQLDQLRQPPIPTPPLPLELNKDKEIKEDIINIQSNDDDQDKSHEFLAILDEKTTPTGVKMHNKKSSEETLLSARQIDQFPSSPSTFALHNRSFRLKIRPDFDYQYADTHLELQPSQFELFQQDQKQSTMSPQQLKLMNKEERGYLKEKSMDATTNSVISSRIVDPPLPSFSSTVQKICELNSTYYDNDQIVSDDNNNSQQLTVLKGFSKITDSGSEQGNQLNSDLYHSPVDESNDGLETTKNQPNSSFPYPHADVEARLNALIDTSTDNSCLKDDLNYFISESHNLPNGEIHNYDYLLPTNITTTTTHSNRIDNLTDNLIRQEDLLNGHSGMETSSLDEHYSQVLRQQRELDEKALAMEHDLRDSMMNKESQRESVLMAEWFKIINTKNDLIHQQTQIAISAKEKDLERKYDHLKIKLQEIIDIPDKFKTKEDEVKEQELINQLVQIVDQRDQLVQKLDTEEQSLSQIDSGPRDHHKNHNSQNNGRFDVHEDATRPNLGSSLSSTPPPVPVIKRHFLDRLLPSSANQSQQQQLQEPAKYLDQNFKNCEYDEDEERRGDPFGERRSNWMFNTLVASPRNAFYNSLPRPAAAFMRSSLRTTQGWDSSVVRVKGEVATGDGKESNFPSTRQEKTADFRYDDTVPSIPISGFSTLQRGLDLPSSLRKQLKTATGSLFSSIKKS